MKDKEIGRNETCMREWTIPTTSAAPKSMTVSSRVLELLGSGCLVGTRPVALSHDQDSRRPIMSPIGWHRPFPKFRGLDASSPAC